ncbi:G-type lectin S-receptor-like serine/threonine-protein kinase LECRK3 [Humulus lupulus]|uniref:G-type lectin S-receptor-like serine/threonine-protein kinase LECRK3 n=1 Tax=Humulus lupulus TaxID=3486 RepID=UPI002B40AF70|nr:G-type lectin S-receptor-like serine/threonine-protein kinase LECRK3 [Humulus lupulus]
MRTSLLISLFILVLLCHTSSTASSNVSLGSPPLTAQLDKIESWLSPSGEFAFGFQQIQKGGFLLAIWFNKIPQKTIVWSANGNNLVHQGSIVELTSLGLVLRDSTGKEVWSTVVSGLGVDHAAMFDTGNLVLANQNNVSLWESFSNPTDTLLPSQILGQDTQLAARYSESNYTKGKFYVKVDEGNLVFYVRQLSTLSEGDISYWPDNPTPSNGVRVTFNKSGSIYLQAQNGTITQELIPPISTVPKSFYQRATLEYDGVLRRYVYPKEDGSNSGGWPSREWSPTFSGIPENICLSIHAEKGPGVCGYNSYCKLEGNGRPSCYCLDGYTFVDSKDKMMKGCKPNFEPQNCDEESEDVKNFVMTSVDNTNWPQGDYEVYASVSEDDCRHACLVDCFCALAIYGYNNCWKKRTPFSNGVKDPSIRLTKTLLKVRKEGSANTKSCGNIDSKTKDKTVQKLVGFVSTSAFLNILLLATSLVFFFRLRRKPSTAESHQTITNTNLQNFTVGELEKATNGFKEQLGVGAFGVVFKGAVDLGNSNSLAIAVKKLDNNMVKEGEKEFMAEVMSIGHTNHKNLVQLIGFCNEGQHRLLVYECMSNGSLGSFLFGSSNKPKWHQRMQIALGIARGLVYLHEECSTQIIHCDIKPQNILLDDSYTARISDFGLAKILKTGQTQTMTGIRGTRGYVAPEWFRNTAVTAKVDVYSYGILLLELICCRKNVEEKVDDAQKILADWACDCYEAGKVEFLVENDEEAMMEVKMVEKYVMVAIWCIQEDPSLRPTMKKVAQMLEGSVKVSTPPPPNSFISSL